MKYFQVQSLMLFHNISELVLVYLHAVVKMPYWPSIANSFRLNLFDIHYKS